MLRKNIYWKYTPKVSSPYLGRDSVRDYEIVKGSLTILNLSIKGEFGSCGLDLCPPEKASCGGERKQNRCLLRIKAQDLDHDQAKMGTTAKLKSADPFHTGDNQV